MDLNNTKIYILLTYKQTKLKYIYIYILSYIQQFASLATKKSGKS